MASSTITTVEHLKMNGFMVSSSLFRFRFIIRYSIGPMSIYSDLPE